MKQKTVVTRKDHKCEGCGEIIPKGTECQYLEGRFPDYDKDDKQIGIWYYKAWVHDYNCTAPESCQNGNHEYEEDMAFDGYVGCHRVYVPTGNNVCVNCGNLK